MNMASSYTCTKHLSMITALFLVFLTTGVSRVLAARELAGVQEMEARHEAWMAEHSRTYKDEAEKARRFEIFRSNAEFVDLFNAAGAKRHRLETNKFADLTEEEFKGKWTGYRRPVGLKTLPGFKYENFSLSDTPDSVDWRKRGAVTGVKDQRQCGSCWAFSAVAAVEGIHQIKAGRLLSLSEQQLVDCSTNGHNHGCDGGFMNDAFQYIKDNGGITTESAYPYKAVQGTCSFAGKSVAAKITGLQDVPRSNEAALRVAVANQPVSVSIDGSVRTFQLYKSGIIMAGTCGTNLTHAVTAVGYGKAGDGTEYWVMKNSWGADWGEAGYVRLQRNVAAKHGVCGLAWRPSFPVAN